MCKTIYHTFVDCLLYNNIERELVIKQYLDTDKMIKI